MKAALFSSARYTGPAPGGWPVPATDYSNEIAQQTMQRALDQFRLADEAGFDWVTVAEHHFAPFSLTPNPMVMAGALTQVVRRAKIALLGATVPILNPIRVAEEFAMLDAMTGGRVVAGMLRGTPNEYVTYHVNPAESRERFEEALRLIQMAWTEKQPFGWQGRHYQYRSVSIWPRPVQRPHPPIYMSGSSPESGEFAAKNRIGLGFAVTSLPLAIKAATHYREQAAIAGWTPTPNEFIYRCTFHCADTDEQAWEDVTANAPKGPRVGHTMSNQALERAIADTGYYGRDIDNQRERLMPGDLKERIDTAQMLLGSPETILKQVKRIRDELGAGIIDFTLGLQLGAKTMKSIELLGTKVVPRMQDL
jgi:alkanesulfonate monooxygenase SsuD/methylene tetrahydromethanopterin reductase-like flavin-dependent oxidoreductase (luciferase family)